MLGFLKLKLIVLLIFLSFSTITFSGYLVVDVVDGDTLWFLDDGIKEKLRLSQIDAPESSQPFGLEATKLLEKLILNKEISITLQSKKDRYGRYLGEVFINDENINKLLVRNGLAWVYDRYVTDDSYYEDLEIAKNKRINIWSDNKQISPWEWRRSH
jgi:micrococcal nuclease|tara:strand:- start:63 stop:533 length:471 start_codon:yes stop_codon:yes gene_type:complete